MPEPTKIFISYSHKDKKWLKLIQTFLAPAGREGLLYVWDDTAIQPGTKWREEINQAIRDANISVLLVTPDFLASDFIAKNELPPLLATTRVFWILINACQWKLTSIKDYQAAHDTSKPLAGLSIAKRNTVLNDICEKLLEAANHPL